MASSSATSTPTKEPVEMEVKEEDKVMEKETVVLHQETAYMVKAKASSTDQNLSVLENKQIDEPENETLVEVEAQVRDDAESVEKGGEDEKGEKTIDQVEAEEETIVKESREAPEKMEEPVNVCLSKDGSVETAEEEEVTATEAVSAAEVQPVPEVKEESVEKAILTSNDPVSEVKEETEEDTSSTIEVVEKLCGEDKEKRMVEEPQKGEEENPTEPASDGNIHKELVTEMAPEVKNTEISSKGSEEKKQEEAKEMAVKPKHSNNIISKMKQSLVKAKKAIIGKSPSSKTISTQAKGDIKVK